MDTPISANTMFFGFMFCAVMTCVILVLFTVLAQQLGLNHKMKKALNRQNDLQDQLQNIQLQQLQQLQQWQHLQHQNFDQDQDQNRAQDQYQNRNHNQNQT